VQGGAGYPYPSTPPSPELTTAATTRPGQNMQHACCCNSLVVFAAAVVANANRRGKMHYRFWHIGIGISLQLVIGIFKKLFNISFEGSKVSLCYLTKDQKA